MSFTLQPYGGGSRPPNQYPAPFPAQPHGSTTHRHSGVPDASPALPLTPKSLSLQSRGASRGWRNPAPTVVGGTPYLAGLAGTPHFATPAEAPAPRGVGTQHFAAPEPRIPRHRPKPRIPRRRPKPRTSRRRNPAPRGTGRSPCILQRRAETAAPGAGPRPPRPAPQPNLLRAPPRPPRALPRDARLLHDREDFVLDVNYASYKYMESS